MRASQTAGPGTTARPGTTAAPGTTARPATTTEPGTTTGSGEPRTRPPAERRGLGRYWWLAGLAIAALIVIVLAPLASPDPDGLERVAEDQGFLGNALQAFYELLPDYRIPGLDGDASTIVAGLIGVVLVFVVMVGLGRVLARRRQ